LKINEWFGKPIGFMTNGKPIANHGNRFQCGQELTIGSVSFRHRCKSNKNVINFGGLETQNFCKSFNKSLRQNPFSLQNSISKRIEKISAIVCRKVVRKFEARKYSLKALVEITYLSK
jgi:hypothetical protein